jgi:hypothetical protein
MAHELTIYSEHCKSCKGAKSIDNPAWGKFVAGLSATELSAGVKSDIPQKIPCPECKGLGVKMNDHFWELRTLFKAADLLDQNKEPMNEQETTRV